MPSRHPVSRRCRLFPGCLGRTIPEAPQSRNASRILRLRSKGRVVFGRECAELAATGVSKTIRDAGSYLGFSIREGCLIISSRLPPPPGPFAAWISLRPQDATESARMMLEITGPDSKRSSPGAIWSTVDMLVERQGRRAFVKLSLELFWNETPSPFLPEKLERPQDQPEAHRSLVPRPQVVTRRLCGLPWISMMQHTCRRKTTTRPGRSRFQGWRRLFYPTRKERCSDYFTGKECNGPTPTRGFDHCRARSR